MNSGLCMLRFLGLIGFAIHSIMPSVKEGSLFYLFNISLTASSEDKIFLVRKKKEEHSEINSVHGLKES